MNTIEHAKDILAGLAVFLVVLAIVGGLFGTILVVNNKNADKQERMNELCISEGHTGWIDNSYDDGPVGCQD